MWLYSNPRLGENAFRSIEWSKISTHTSFGLDFSRYRTLMEQLIRRRRLDRNQMPILSE